MLARRPQQVYFHYSRMLFSDLLTRGEGVAEAWGLFITMGQVDDVIAFYECEAALTQSHAYWEGIVLLCVNVREIF